jgi:CubicO group peptidase (beta-lactamase class C family)
MASDNKLHTSTPEAQGIPSGAILAFLQAAEESIDALHSFMLLRHGAVVAQGWWTPYGPDLRHVLFSLSKSFTSTAVGLAVAEGRLTVDDTLLSIFPEFAPEEISDNLAGMKVRHLLSMSTGHAEDTTGRLFGAQDGKWVKAFMALPVEYEPGTHFLYNTGATYVLSAIVQKLTGMTLMDYLTPRLFEPLGIKDAWWEVSPEGVAMGGFGLNVKTEDIARFGQLYLQKGVWNGQRILPEAWVAEATSRQVSNEPNTNIDWRQGYGYQFWRCQHNAYRGDGAFGQYCIVMPDQDAVIAITSGVGNMQAVLDLIWGRLLPAMGPAALPDDPEAQAQLARRLAGLELLPQVGAATSPWADRVSGRTYAFDVAEQNAVVNRHGPSDEAQLIHAIEVVLHGHEGGTLTIRDGRGDNTIAFAHGAWRRGETQLGVDEPHRYAASGAWIDEDTLVVKLCLYETPFRPTLTLQFGQGGVRYQHRMNVGFGPGASPALVGKLL